jgi:hypothetical protein
MWPVSFAYDDEAVRAGLGQEWEKAEQHQKGGQKSFHVGLDGILLGMLPKFLLQDRGIANRMAGGKLAA